MDRKTPPSVELPEIGLYFEGRSNPENRWGEDGRSAVLGGTESLQKLRDFLHVKFAEQQGKRLELIPK